MNRFIIITSLLLMLALAGSASAGTWVFAGDAGCTNCEVQPCNTYGPSLGDLVIYIGNTYHISTSVSASFNNAGCTWCNGSCAGGEVGSQIQASTFHTNVRVCSDTHGGTAHGSVVYTETTSSSRAVHPEIKYAKWSTYCCDCSGSGTIIISNESAYTASGITGCVDSTALYIFDGSSYYYVDDTTSPSYSFQIFNGSSYRLLFNGAYYDFTCDGNEVYDYDACYYVYGYTCGVDSIKLYKDSGGWVLDDSTSQETGYDVYEMQIADGKDYKISFIESGTVVHNQTFSCSGANVLIDSDRCQWIYPPSPWATPYTIYLWAGYDYNIVVFKDEHGNFIENSQLAIYDKTDNQYLQRWTDAVDGYTLLGARFATDHDILLSLRTFDGTFTLETTYPANGSAAVGEEDIMTTNWTIPIKYNLNVLPVDQYGAALFDVFCGLSEYTPLNPGAFWGIDLSDQGYVPVTNCSGFAMCDIIAEKDGYSDFSVEALNWTTKSAMVKDYRYTIIMEEE